MRECGECSVCCYIGAVPALDKGPHEHCRYECDGCSIYGRPERPFDCKEFECSWLCGFGDDESRPDKSGVMVSINDLNGGRWTFVIETKANALETTGRGIVSQMARKFNFPIIVADHKSKPPDDKGDRMIIREEFVKHTKRMRGEFLGHLDEEKSLLIYKLRAN